MRFSATLKGTLGAYNTILTDSLINFYGDVPLCSPAAVVRSRVEINFAIMADSNVRVLAKVFISFTNQEAFT